MTHFTSAYNDIFILPTELPTCFCHLNNDSNLSHGHVLPIPIYKTIPDFSIKYFSEASAAEKKKRLKHRKTFL